MTKPPADTDDQIGVKAAVALGMKRLVRLGEPSHLKALGYLVRYLLVELPILILMTVIVMIREFVISLSRESFTGTLISLGVAVVSGPVLLVAITSKVLFHTFVTGRFAGMGYAYKPQSA